MLVFEAKLEGADDQYRALDEALRTGRYVRNSCLRYWMDNIGVGRYDLNKYCAVLAAEFEWAKKLNSMARQAHAERVAAPCPGFSKSRDGAQRERHCPIL